MVRNRHKHSNLTFAADIRVRGTIPRSPFSTPCYDRGDGYQCQPEISHHWGQYSPFFSVPSEISADVPAGCRITFAQVLARHGSRDPTLGRSIVYAALLERIQRDVTSFSGHYAFLKDYEYTLGADQLTAFGQREMYRAGEAFYKRYRTLTNGMVPFVRASDSHRVVVSAQNFTQGMRNAATDDEAEVADAYPVAIAVIPETKTANNTLNNGLCDALETGYAASVGHHAQREWLSVFALPIQDRLNTGLPGANLSSKDVLSLMDLCPFNTVASAIGALSQFCDLFTKNEWASYDYYQSLGKYYGHGNGNPFGPTQGVGFVNELVARLSGKAVQDHTSVNHTLDDDPQSFPLGDGHVLFADFSHDNDITAVHAALGLYNQTLPLSNSTAANATQSTGYSAAWTVPFAARTFVEKMQCSGVHEEQVRVLVNDRVIPLSQCESDSLGRCKVSRFVESLRWAQDGGRWDECFKKI